APARARPRVRGSRAGPRRAAAVEGGAAEPVGKHRIGRFRPSLTSCPVFWVLESGVQRTGVAKWVGLLILAVLVGCPREDRPVPLSGVSPARTLSGPSSVSPPVLRVDLPAHEARRQVPLPLTPQILRQAVRAGALVVRVADGSSYRVVIHQVKAGFGGRTTIVGRVRTRLGMQSAVLTFGSSSISGVLPQPHGPLLSINTLAGQVVVGQDRGRVPEGIDPARHPDYRVPALPSRRPGAAAGALSGAPPRTLGVASELSEVQVDVLGLYSDELVALRGSVEAAETDLASTIAIATQAHVDSGSRVRLALVAAEQVSLPAGIFN